MSYGERDKLFFLGRSGAHISHELKNILATISETAGLMGDLVALARSGQGPDPDKLTGLTRRIEGLVDRGNETVRNLNALSHSVDEPVRDADAGGEVALAVGLSQYAPFARQVDLEGERQEELELRLRSFEVQHLLAEVLAAAYATIESDQRLGVRLEPGGDGVAVVISGAGAPEADSAPLARALAICDALGTARLELDAEQWTLTLSGE